MLPLWGGQNNDTEPMDTSDYPWYWFYQAECGIWHKMEDHPVIPISRSYLEKLYFTYPFGNIDFNTAGGHFKIDFKGFLKTNLRTGQTQRLKRSLLNEHMVRCNCEDRALSVPAHWDDMDSKTPFKKVLLDPQTSEFQEVAKYVKDIGLLQEPLKHIYRIQNVDLWELYCRKRSQLMRIKGQSDIEERRLFHGTYKNNVPNICLYNFDCRISDSRRRGHILGKGTYFATHASYADKYSRTGSQGGNSTRMMFLARVIVGKYTTGQPHFCKPDGDQNDNIHDSCVDNTLYPRIFVIFNSNQIYPEYVLEYVG